MAQGMVGVQGLGCMGFRFRVWDLGCMGSRYRGSGFREGIGAQGLRHFGSRYRAQGFGFWVLGLGLGV